jgi:predicted amidohydrolase
MDSYLDRLIKLSLDEDLGSAGDVTTTAVVHPNAKGTAVLLAKVDPWGLVVARASEGEGFAMAELDSAYLEKVRRTLPALSHRRL